MRILDRYIIRQYLVNFAILLVVLMSLVILVDFILSIDEFLEAGRLHAQHLGSGAAGLAYALWDYYFPLVCLLYVFLCGLVAMGAMGFTCAGLARSGELVAMVTAGVSMYRIAAPAIVAGCVLCALALPLQELAIPPLAAKLARGKSELKSPAPPRLAVRYARDGRGHLLSAASLDPQTGRLTEVTILERDAEGRLSRRIEAASAAWDAAAGGWTLIDGMSHRRAMQVDPQAPVERAGQLETFFATDLSPQVLLVRREPVYMRLLDMGELVSMAGSKAADAGAIWRVVHARFAGVVVSALILVMAMPFFLTREPANFMVQAVRAVAVCMGAWGASLMIMQTDLPLPSPVMTAWLPVALLLPAAAWLAQRVKT